MATMTLESFMPARCWIAPEMPHGDVEFRRDHLAGLADLPVVRRVAGVDGGARGADGGAQLVGDRQDDFLELLAEPQRAAAGDDDLGARSVPDGRLGSGSPTKTTGPDRPRHRRSRPKPNRRSPAASKDAVRTVMTFFASVDCTVWMALPA
jgi:hypothetical protein